MEKHNSIYQKKKMLRKQKYYDAHPEEAVEDHIKQIKTGSDDFIMEKVEQWEKEQQREDNMANKVKTPKYWEKELFQPLIEVETAYGNKVMIPKPFSGGWEMAKIEMEFIKSRGQEPLDILQVGQDSNPDKERNPMYFDLEQVFYELYEEEQENK